MLTTLKLNIPKSIKNQVNEKNILSMLMFSALSKMEYYRSRLLNFEKKYNNNFTKFKKKIEKSKKENFNEWDDFIIWEGIQDAYIEWKTKYIQLKKCLK